MLEYASRALGIEAIRVHAVLAPQPKAEKANPSQGGDAKLEVSNTR